MLTDLEHTLKSAYTPPDNCAQSREDELHAYTNSDSDTDTDEPYLTTGNFSTTHDFLNTGTKLGPGVRIPGDSESDISPERKNAHTGIIESQYADGLTAETQTQTQTQTQLRDGPTADTQREGPGDSESEISGYTAEIYAGKACLGHTVHPEAAFGDSESEISGYSVGACIEASCGGPGVTSHIL
jgi:hypothetical protein